LWSLYLLRVLGGFADSTLLVTATAYVADSTPEAERPRGMAWLGTAVSLGLVAGPALTGVLVGADIAVLHLDGPSVPFVFSGLLATLVLGLSGRHLARSNRSPTPAPHAHHARHRRGLRVTAATLGPLLVLVFAAQYGLAIFEGMFVLYARDRLTLSLTEISLTFIACNAVVAVMQLPAVDWLTARVSSLRQVALGFAVMGLSLVGLLAVRSFPLVLVMSAAHGAGAALLIPNLSALVSSRANSGAGLALGLKNSASGLGQFIGPVVGGSLIGVQTELPFIVAAALLIAVAVAVQGGFAANVRHPSSPTVCPLGAKSRFGALVGGSWSRACSSAPVDVPGRDEPGRWAREGRARGI
jgi:DHA1 family multidrug resistance protein-like MFS transporter